MTATPVSSGTFSEKRWGWGSECYVTLLVLFVTLNTVCMYGGALPRRFWTHRVSVTITNRVITAGNTVITRG